MSTVLHISPHPDDEALGAGGTLLSLGDQGWRVVTLACSLGRRNQAARRRVELQEACRRAGFELRETSTAVGISSGDDFARAQGLLARDVSRALAELAPRVLIGPSPHDGHHGHEVVGHAIAQAITQCPPASRPRLWLWELWSLLPTPTLYVPLAPATVAQTALVLDAHLGELQRNDYTRAMKARAELAATLGVERVFGWGTTGRQDRYAEILMEILCDQQDGWPLARPRVLDPTSPLDAAVPSGIDIGSWLQHISARAEILGHR